MTDPIGQGRWRVGESGKTALCVEIDDEKDAALAKLKAFRGVKKAEVVDLGLELVLKHSPDEIADMIAARRKGTA